MENLPSLPNPNNQIDVLIAKAIEERVPVEFLKTLLDARELEEAKYARKEYFNSLGQFQSRCPIIKKNRRVADKQGRLLYNYASIEYIVYQVKDLLYECGFSYMINTIVEGDLITSNCISTHILGHTEIVPYTVKIGVKVEHLTPAQEIAVASTYSKRYAFCNCYGIMTSDRDLDGAIHATSIELITEEEIVELRELLTTHNLQEEEFVARAKISKLEELSRSKATAFLERLRE